MEQQEEKEEKYKEMPDDGRQYVFDTAEWVYIPVKN